MKCDRDGTFKAVAFFNGFQKASDAASRSLGLRIRCELYQMLDATGWIPWAEFQQEIEHTVWIRKRDGGLNEIAAENLIVLFNWSGDLNAMQEGSELGHCQVVVEYERDNRPEHANKQYLKAKYLNALGGKTNTALAPEPAEVKEAAATLGPQLRALAANVKRNRPPAPASPPAQHTPELAGDDDPPF